MEFNAWDATYFFNNAVTLLIFSIMRWHVKFNDLINGSLEKVFVIAFFAFKNLT